LTDIWRWGSAEFSNIPVAARDADRALAVIRRHQGKLLPAGLAAIGIGAAVFAGVGYVRHERLAATQEAATRHVESANADLQDAVTKLRDQLGTTSQTLALTQSRIAALSEEAHRQVAVSEETASSKSERAAQLTRGLEQAQREAHLAEAQRISLWARLNKAETDLGVRQQQVQANLDEWQKKVQQLTADRDKAAAERDQLRARIAVLEQKLSMRTQSPPRPTAEAQPQPQPQPHAQAAPQAIAAPPASAAAPPPAAVATATPAAAAVPAVAAVAPRPAATVAVAAVNRGGIAQFERVLASTGVDVKNLFSQFGVRNGEGGPFIPAPRGGMADTTLSPDKLAALSRLVKALPVTAPLQDYEIGSSFGERGDPINGRAAFHTGLDFRAPLESPVYATAPGVVTFAGYRDDYGKIVEIDHGHGISTRYGHLHRFVVSVGQRVALHQEIGLLGSTGRATGPHVHYEVLVNGEPQDPAKFMGLARLVPIAVR
jgi:murein DD-endopeptidase MepM/ murein hydrolase activator NlpD